MDDDTLRWVRIEAAKQGLSVSRWIGRELSASRQADIDQAAASARIERFLEEFPGLPLSENGKITIDRDELYDDGRFRRFDHDDLSAGPSGASEESALRGVAEGPEGQTPFDP
ncbi:MAG TPA: hypothetical protein VHW60_06180 [Caulobacteraceae bacterium]|nr:hypothetical protein [Caulobacteraceae bacterium]